MDILIQKKMSNIHRALSASLLCAGNTAPHAVRYYVIFTIRPKYMSLSGKSCLIHSSQNCEVGGAAVIIPISQRRRLRPLK